MPATWVFHRGVVNHTMLVKSWSYQRSRSSGVRWSLTLSHSQYWPTGAIGQLFEPFERSGGVLQSWIDATFESSGNPDHLTSQLVILDVNWDHVDGSLQCEISGVDIFTERLQFEGVALGDRRSMIGNVYDSRGIVSEVCQACGISSGAVETGLLTNTVVPVFHAVGQGLSLVKNLIELVQGWWKADEGSIRFYDGGIDPDGFAADFSLPETLCTSIQWRKSSAQIYNRATYERVSETKFAYGPAEGFGFGSQTINLAFGVNEGVLRVVPYGQGTVENPVWDDVGGTPLTPSPTFVYRGSTPATRVRFTLTPSVAWGAVPMAYLAEVGGYNNQATIDPFEAGFLSTYDATADQAIRGILPFPEPFISELCADQATGALAAQKVTLEQLLGYSSVNFGTVMNTAHDVGLIAQVSVSRFGFSNKKFLVQSVDWSGDETQELEQLELSRGSA